MTESIGVDIDITFDFRTDAGGRDPDKYSRTLKRYHQRLWSKPLPNGIVVTLTDLRSKGYLQFQSKQEEFELSSDTVIRTFTHVRRMKNIIDQIPHEDREDALRRGYTIGGMMLFPARKIDGKHTINQARGTNRRIEDRFDLTLECIRRHYDGGTSPLAADLQRYCKFFQLFGDFMSYVNYFFLQDLVESDYSAIKFWKAFKCFDESPFPIDLNEYILYRKNMMTWVASRNQRILKYLRNCDEKS